MSQLLILIRHSMVTMVPGTPASNWHLSDDGRKRALRLAQHIEQYQPDRVITSVEPKAIETGEIIAETLHLPFATKSGLHEHERSRVPLMGREWFEARVQEFFAAPDQLVFGDETADAAHRRFNLALEDSVQRYSSENLAVVTHGTVLTLYISRLTKTEPYTFWQQLGLPAFVVLSLPQKQIAAVQHEIEEL